MRTTLALTCSQIEIYWVVSSAGRRPLAENTTPELSTSFATASERVASPMTTRMSPPG